MRTDTTSWRKWSVVVEEKIDGANLGLRWSPKDGCVFQSRGHLLRGGKAEAQFAPVYNWGASRAESIQAALGTRYMVYGEWCYAKHRAFYDALPDLFIGFDVLDLESGMFLASGPRNEVLGEAGLVRSPGLYQGVFAKAPAFGSFLGKSRFKTKDWRKALAVEAERVGARDYMKETDDSDDMEGVYVRVESADHVLHRMKLHRDGFEKVTSEGWGRGPFIRNQVRVGA